MCVSCEESQAVVPGAGVAPLYGLDLPGSAGVVLSKAFAARLPRNESLRFQVAGRAAEFPVARVVDAGPEEFLALDVAEAQKVLGRYGKLDRIDAGLEIIGNPDYERSPTVGDGYQRHHA